MLTERKQAKTEYILYDPIPIKFQKMQINLVLEVQSSVVREWEERDRWITKVNERTFRGYYKFYFGCSDGFTVMSIFLNSGNHAVKISTVLLLQLYFSEFFLKVCCFSLISFRTLCKHSSQISKQFKECFQKNCTCCCLSARHTR